MCFVKRPKMPEQKTPAVAPPPPEDSAATAQGAPENEATAAAAVRGNKGRNKLRIDLSAGGDSAAGVRNRLVYDKPRAGGSDKSIGSF